MTPGAKPGMSTQRALRLYSYWRSSSAWRVRIALGLKQLEYDYVAVHLLRDGGEQFHDAFVAHSPMAQVPVLQIRDGDEVLSLGQSMAIVEYLDERFPDPPLLPRTPRDRALARQLAEIVNSGIQPLQNLRLQTELRTLGVDPGPLVRGFIERGLSALETLATPLTGRYLMGDKVSLADIWLVPQMFAARRNGVDVSAFEVLQRVEQTCAEHPAFQAAHPDVQPDARRSSSRPPPP